ncbi:MAG: hypothetical protein KJ726_10440 [Verrucomicrobia bacterium]|nr:hypothetical protein [Verrucomicrobiota bacterium]MBU1910453.1 hypothetical protein [Verrucomicrobiota bacterium]
MNSRQKAKQWPFPRHKYFIRDLRNAAAAWFHSHEFTTHPRMAYCLSGWDQWKSNIILPEVASYIANQSVDAQEKEIPFPLHKYLHHGLSSQAMAFNLIGPLITREDYKPLCDALRRKNIQGVDKIVSASFEYEDRDVFNEDAGQPTSIDIVLKNAGGQPRVFIESKLVEQEFGGCSVFGDGDCSGMNPIGCEDNCFLHFIGRKYWPLMAKHGITESVKTDRQCLFTAHYQFFREIILAIEKGGTFVLLSDERSPVFKCRSGDREKGLMPFLTGLLPEQLRAFVTSISTQELVCAIKEYKSHHDWVFEFEKKYGMAEQAA